jgi:hypothetical protein
MLVSLAPIPSPVTAVVRVAGHAWQISPARFNAALRRSSAIGTMVQMFTELFWRNYSTLRPATRGIP